MRHISVRALIIKKRNFREHDQFVTMFSPQLGKFEVTAKGVRKINSSFMGHLEIMNLCQVQLYAGNQRYTLTQCQAEKTFQNIRNSLPLSLHALTMLEIFDRAVHSPEKGEELLNLLLESLSMLEQKKDYSTWVETFKIKLLTLTGSMPEISVCTRCHLRWQDQEKIVLRNGTSLLCSRCTSDHSPSDLHTNNAPIPIHQDLIIPFNIMKLINHLAITETAKVSHIQLSQQEEQSLKNLTRSFLREYLSIDLNSEKISMQLQTTSLQES